MKMPYGMQQDDVQKLLIKIATDACYNMTVSSLFTVRNFIEAVLDTLCPEWRKLDKD